MIQVGLEQILQMRSRSSCLRFQAMVCSFTSGQARFGIEAIADCFAELMTDVLGYRRFGAQGGDWGSRITARLGLAYPERMSGLHLNMMPVGHNAEGLSARTPEESRYLEELRAWLKEESGYGYFPARVRRSTFPGGFEHRQDRRDVLISGN